MTMFRRTLMAAALVALLPAGLAHATLINLDVQGHTTQDANEPDSPPWIDGSPDGVPALQNINDQWNYHADLTAGSSTALDDVNGAASGVTFTLLTDSSSGVKSGAFDDVARDEIHPLVSSAAGVQWKLSGLKTDGTTYDLYVIAANIWSGSWADIEVTHGSGSEVKQLTTPNNGGVSVKYTGGPINLGGHYQEFLGILPDGNGEISGAVNDYNAGTGDRYFSGLQLQEIASIPEPASLLLAIFSGMACLVGVRRG